MNRFRQSFLGPSCIAAEGYEPKGEDMDAERRIASSRSDFIRLAGIEPELGEFVVEFVERPENFSSISFARRREIENQMDAILSSFGRHC